MTRSLRLGAVTLSCWLLLTAWHSISALAGGYYMLVGCRLVRFDALPVVQSHSQTFISIAVLDELLPPDAEHSGEPSGAGKPLGGRSEGQDEEPEEDAPHQTPVAVEAYGGGQRFNVLPVPASLTPQRAGRQRYRLAGHALDIALPGQPFAVELNNRALPSLSLFEHGGQRYIAASELNSIGLLLGFDAAEDLYRLSGLIYRIDLVGAAGAFKSPSLVLNCLTPMRVDGAQGEDGVVTLVANGGVLVDTTARDFAAGEVVSKIGLKSQPELGRAYLFVKQPQRTGFKIANDPRVGFSRISFGNYFQVVSYKKSSSGEISLNVQLGTSSTLQHELVENPPRLVLDFAGAVFDDPSKTIKIDQGRVQNIRVGSPSSGNVRVVLDLTELADYRVLTDDGGARYFVQLLPPAGRNAPVAQRRLGRTIMLDPGHGGSDPGAAGVISGVWEAALNLRITKALADELRSLGYDVLVTRNSDRFTSLGARSDYANGVLPYLFVSIHCNSIEKPDFQGLMTFHHPTSLSGQRLAGQIQSSAIAATGAVDKSVRTANFFVLRETVMPSVLVECGFLTNAEECAKLASPQYQQRLAQGIAAGIDQYVTDGF